MSRAALIGAVLVLLSCGHAVAADAPAAPAPAAPAASPAATAASPVLDVDAAVKLFNPDLLSVDNRRLAPMESTFNAPASDIAELVRDNTWFSFMVFVPFLVLPQVLLLFAMFKFRDRKDGRRPATFMHNTRLENLWTGIPILSLFIVAIPVFPLLYKMESPPEGGAEIPVTVRGKSFAWDYDYKRQNVQIGQDLVGVQESLVLPRGKTVALSITSNDVNHAWWVPAFGVKKDAIMGRSNYTWFTPTRNGFYRGQCAELCGQGHGVMIIGSVIVDPAHFDLYIDLQRNKGDTRKAWDALEPAPGTAFSADALKAAVAKYLEKDRSPARVYALRYWAATNYVALSRVPPNAPLVRNPETMAAYEQSYKQWQASYDLQRGKDTPNQPSAGEQAIAAKRALLDQAIAAVVPAAVAQHSPTPAQEH